MRGAGILLNPIGYYYFETVLPAWNRRARKRV